MTTTPISHPHAPPTAAADVPSAPPPSATVPPPPLPIPQRSAVPHNRNSSALAANSIRLAAVAERLKVQLNNSARNDADFVQLSFALARGIDYALSNEDTPKTAHFLPSIIKQVYLHRNEPSLQTAILVLMISTKNACRKGWFQCADADELLSMANELCSSFCMEVSGTTEAGNVLDTISKIMHRFYPKLMFGHLIVSLQAKPGYDILMGDFHVGRNLFRQERILLFVVQTDNLETSSCITGPPQVSFLINGKGVEKRTNVSQDSGPQFPTDITWMLKYGTNIIQAVGYFTGHYLIAIAIVGRITSSSVPILKDYVQPTVSALASDTEIIEGPSRITLNCPISFRRIKTPVKGHLCKHHQCFDYENFMEMNSRKPSWRCPCCNQSACFVDLRIDQNMVKILGEVGEDVGDVVVFADGTWKVDVKHHRSMDQLSDGTHAGRQDSDIKCLSNKSACTITDAVDLTMEEDVNSCIINGRADQSDNITCGTEDRKPFHGIQGFPVSQGLSEPSLGNCTTQADGYHIANDIQPSFLSSISASNISLFHTRPDGHAEQPLVSMLPNATITPNGSSSSTYQSIHSDVLDAVSYDMDMLEVPRTSDIPVRKNRDQQEQQQLQNPAVQQVTSRPAPNYTSSTVPLDKERVGAYRAPLQSTSYHQIPPSQLPTLRVYRPVIQPANILQSPHVSTMQAGHTSQNVIGSTAGSVANRHDSLMSANLAVADATKLQAGAGNSHLFEITSSNSSQRTADSLRIAGIPEQNWHPTGRMRGSLTGSAYSSALNQYLVPSIQPVPTRPPASTVTSISNSLSVLVANNSELVDL